MKFATVVLLGVFGCMSSARAADDLLLSGTQWAPLGSYSYVGVLSPVGEGSLGQGWVMRHWLDRLTYEYESGPRKIRAESFGYAPALGYQTRLGSSRVGIFGAVRLSDTDLSPDDRSNADRGRRGRFSLQAEASVPLARAVENQLLAQAEFGNGGYFVRDRIQFRIFDRYTFGPEAVLKGNDAYRAWQAGLSLGGISIGARAKLLLGGGIHRQHGQSSEGYGALELAIAL